MGRDLVAIFFLNDNNSAMSIATVSVVAAHVWTLSFTDMGGDKTRAAQVPL